LTREAALQAGLQGVIGGVGDAGDFADGRILARRGLRDGAAGVEAAA